MTALTPHAADGPPPSAAGARPGDLRPGELMAALHTVVLSAPDDAPIHTAEEVRPRRVALQLGGAALIVVILVGLVGALVSRQVAQRQAVHDVAELTDVLAQSSL